MLGSYALGQYYAGWSPSGLSPTGASPTPIATNPIAYHFSLVVSHAGVSVPYRVGTLHINNTAGQVQTCEFDVVDTHASITLSIGSAISVMEDMVSIFQGDVDEVGFESLESPYDVNSSGVHTGTPVGARILSVRCVGYSNRAFNTLTGFFSAQARVPLAVVVASLASTLGVASDIIVTGNPTLPGEFLSDNEPVSSALQRLADLATSISGFVHTWRVERPQTSFATTTLRFGPPSGTGGYGIGTGGFKPRAYSIKGRTTREEFKNTIVLKLDKYLQTEPQVEDYLGSAIFLGTLKLAYPCAGAPKIDVTDQDDQTVGIKGVDTGKDWYWNAGSNVLTVGDSAVGGGDTITVTYEALDIRVITAKDDTSRALVGAFEMPFSAGDSSNSLSPTDLANAELARRNGLTTQLKLTLRCPPGIFQDGQSVTVTLPHLTSGTFYIRSMRQYDWQGEVGTVVWRELDLINGPGIYTSAQFLQRLTR